MNVEELILFGLQVPSSLHEDKKPSSSGAIELVDEIIEQPEPSCVETLNKGIDDVSTVGICTDLIPNQDMCMDDITEENSCVTQELQEQSNASSYKAKVVCKPRSPHNLEN